jgi:hypothetical protein
MSGSKMEDGRLTSGRKHQGTDLTAGLAHEIVAEWFVANGTIEHVHELDLSRKFTDYGFTGSVDFSRFWNDVASAVAIRTGRKLLSPNDRLTHYSYGTIAAFVSALPGESSTSAGGPF